MAPEPTTESVAYRSALDVVRAVEPRVADAIGAEIERPARVAQADRQRELRLPGRAAGHGQLVQRQVRRGHHRPPLLRGLPQRRHRRGAGRRARPRAVRRRPRLRAAALRHRRQPGRLLGGALAAGGVPGAASGRGAPGQRPRRGRTGRSCAAPSATSGCSACRWTPAATSPTASGRTSRARCSTSAATAPTRRPGCSTTTRCARRAREFRPLIIVAGYSAYPRLVNFRIDAGDRRRGRRHAHGGHGALRRPGRGQGAHRRLRPGAARADRHHDHAQVAARPARRHGAVRRRAGGARRPRLPDGARRPAAARDGRQGGRARRGVGSRPSRTTRSASWTTRGRWPTDCSRAARPWSPAAPTTTSCCIDVSGYGLTGRQAEAALLDAGIVTNRNSVPQRPERRLVHLRHPDRHPRADHPRPRRGGDGRDRRAHRHRAVGHDRRGVHRRRRAVQGQARPGRRRSPTR